MKVRRGTCNAFPGKREADGGIAARQQVHPMSERGSGLTHARGHGGAQAFAEFVGAQQALLHRAPRMHEAPSRGGKHALVHAESRLRSGDERGLEAS